MGIPKPLVQLNQLFIVLSVLTALASNKLILVLPFAIGVYTLITKKNPIISAGKMFLKKPLSHYVMEDKDQQIFNQWIATVCLGLSLAFFQLGWSTIAYVFSVMVLLAAGIALMGFCIGCAIRYRYIMWKHKRRLT
ncbi:DUF4395 domain-containing protein [Peribacillus glennii]|uniref:DUF4395 domain-containing protein n=1 Tax=Peribacillus glennii TaxID=2303991 RepID=A0A372L8L2_9BACI|nr:DUF4395 domain-containing protein [Peribacillus glennii]RFU61257.1 DUF4395 domain-containing protein [Peribacillus glennii]